MSYDIYCYKSKLGRPDEDEADAVIEADNQKLGNKERNPDAKLALVKALKTFNPKLEAFDFDYGEIAELTGTTIQEARGKFDHIELNPPEGDLAIQLIVYDNSVVITVPYWHKGDKAIQLFSALRGYIKVIRDAAGYFVWDPQTGQVFDPAENEFEGLNQYLTVSEHVDKMINPKEVHSAPRKPWWKFW